VDDLSVAILVARSIGKRSGCLIGIPCINARIGFSRDADGNFGGSLNNAVLDPGPFAQHGALVPTVHGQQLWRRGGIAAGIPVCPDVAH
jgi:hypothetical protein